jgi:hypothetical protein
MPIIDPQGEQYNDDRMYLLYIAKCTTSSGSDGVKVTTIHHSDAPADSHWCVVTCRNTPRFSPTRVDEFNFEPEARAFLERIEPTIPLVSLGGRQPQLPMPYPEWAAWKRSEGMQDFDYRKLYPAHAEHAQETLYSLPQFGGPAAGE